VFNGSAQIALAYSFYQECVGRRREYKEG